MLPDNKNYPKFYEKNQIGKIEAFLKKGKKKWSHISFEIVSSPEECIFYFHSKKRGYGVAFLTIDCNVVFSTFWIISIDAAREMIKLS